jgi:hypothetical protein
MARESRRKREERRFGRPERLVDQMHQWDWLVFDGQQIEPPDVLGLFDFSPCFLADNVTDYFLNNLAKGWEWTGLPGLRLPFPSLFIESSDPCGQPQVRIGAFICEGRPVADILSDISRYPDKYQGTRVVNDHPLISERCRHTIDFGLYFSDASARRIMHLARGTVLVDGDHLAIRSPMIQVDKDLGSRFASYMQMKMALKRSLFPLFLAVGFMNCKNVALRSVAPDPAPNRERLKVGLKPFLRYHVLDIEPMKTVLRTEGQVETQGLQKALHIVRGHFATYSPERPLFGKVAGTFWVPSHTRGSLEHGIVAKDYRVGAPRPVKAAP